MLITSLINCVQNLYASAKDIIVDLYISKSCEQYINQAAVSGMAPDINMLLPAQFCCFSYLTATIAGIPSGLSESLPPEINSSPTCGVIQGYSFNDR